MDFDLSWGEPVVIFGFVLALVFLNGVFGMARENSRRQMLRDLLQSDREIDDQVLETISGDVRDSGSTLTGGLVLIAVAIGLVFLGYQIEKVEPTEPVFDIMLGVAAIPFLIGVVLVIGSLLRRSKD